MGAMVIKLIPSAHVAVGGVSALTSTFQLWACHSLEPAVKRVVVNLYVDESINL